LTDTDLEEIRRRRRDRNRLGLRQWIVVFLTVCAGDQAGVAAHAWIIPVVGALISFLGVPAGLIGNELSIRYGSRTIATLVFLLSALAGGLLGFTAMLPYITVLGLSVIAGFIVQGNFSNLTSGSSQSPLPSTGGRRSGCIPASALAPHSSARSCSAFTLDQFGGISQLAAWIVGFGTCGLACLAGAAATMFLPRDVWKRSP
jgi:hypothetical protein